MPPGRPLVLAPLRSFSSRTLIASSTISINSRHFSSFSSTTTTLNKISSTALKNHQSASSLNPPDVTLPPPLALPPPREVGTSQLSHLYRTGKGFLTFYKTAIKAVFSNFKSAYQLRSDIESRLEIKGGLNWERELIDGRISRSEYHHFRRAKRDMSKIPLFALLFAACGEFTPLVVMAVSGIVPYPARIPAQIAKDESRREDKRYEGRHQIGLLGGGVSDAEVRQRPLRKMASYETAIVARSVGIKSQRMPSFIPLPPTLLLRRRIQRHMRYVAADDLALLADAASKASSSSDSVSPNFSKSIARSVSRLTTPEVKLALLDRGIAVTGIPDEELRSRLVRWLGGRVNLLKSIDNAEEGDIEIAGDDGFGLHAGTYIAGAQGVEK